MLARGVVNRGKGIVRAQAPPSPHTLSSHKQDDQGLICPQMYVRTFLRASNRSSALIAARAPGAKEASRRHTAAIWGRAESGIAISSGKAPESPDIPTAVYTHRHQSRITHEFQD